jgi:RHS repeat-associated protein
VGAADDAGALVQQVAYDPWGVPLVATDKAITSTVALPGFQGHSYEADTGLYDLRARWYDPEVGRFLSPDPVRTPYATAGLNAYVFGMNNPLRYTDPTGEIVPLIIAAAIIGAAFYASYSGASYAFSTSWECFSGWEMARRIAVGAAIGAAVGAGGYLLGVGAGAAFGAMGLSSLAAGIAGGVVGGAATGAAESVLSQLFLQGRSFSDLDGGDILRSAIIGALAGGITGGMTHMFAKPGQMVFDFFISKMSEGLGGSFSQLFLGI